MSNSHMRVGPEYFRLISHFEKGKQGDPDCRLTASGAALDAYLCPANVPTIGAGSIRRLDGSPVQMGDSVTEEEVFLLAERDAEHAADAVRKIKRPLKQHQFDALTAFTHNLGEGNLQKLAPLVEEGRWEDVAEKMFEYVRAWRTYEGKPYFAALLGLRIRRLAEGLLLNGREWQDLCDPDDIGMPRQKPPLWQPDGPTKTGRPGRYFDVLLTSGATQYTDLEAVSRPLASLAEPSELVLNTPAPAPQAAGNGAAPARPPSPAQASAPPEKSASVGPPLATAESGVSRSPPTSPAVKPAPAPVPAKLPKLPDPPVPIGQQTSAVDGAKRSEEWSSGTKAMWQSRRFYGLVLIMAGRLWMLKTGSNAFLGAVSDPLVMEFVGGFGVMIAGELIQSWGRAKAKKALH